MYGAPTPPHPRVQLLPGTSLGRVYFRWQGADCSCGGRIWTPFSVGYPPLHPCPASFRHQPSASSWEKAMSCIEPFRTTPMCSIIPWSVWGMGYFKAFRQSQKPSGIRYTHPSHIHTHPRKEGRTNGRKEANLLTIEKGHCVTARFKSTHGSILGTAKT